MRKILPLLVVGIFVLSGLGAVAGTNIDEEQLKSERLIFSNPAIKIIEDYTSIEINEANSFIMKQGKPMLPSYVKTYTFPSGTKINNVDYEVKDIQTQTLVKDIMPTPLAVSTGLSVNKATQELDYGVDPYPKNCFEYDISSGIINGERKIILDIEISPVKYYPAENKIDWAKQVDIDISYEEPESQNSRDQYELLVIAPDEYSDELASLITHKNNRGVSAKYTGLNEIYSGTGRDNAEKIKIYIKDAIETWGTTNVLLVGSYSKLPARSTHVVSEDPDDDEVFVTDLYYADVYDGENDFCDWDSNENDIFGEYNNGNNVDEVDLNPDVIIGRLPATTGSQVNTVVNKIKTYENDVAYQEDWFTDMVTIGGDTSPGYETLEGEYINQIVIDMMDGFSATKLWVSNGKLTGYIPKTGLAYIKDSIGAGCGFVDFSGHGNTNVWATHPEEDGNTWVPTPYTYLASSHIATLSNGDKLPIVAVEACSTAKFNKDTNTLNWAFLSNSNGGAIGAFGNTALGWGYVGDGISQGLSGKMGLDTFRSYRYDDAITLGEMWSGALARYIKPSMDALDYKTTEEWILFGDPTLQIGEQSNPPAKPSTPAGPTNGGTGKTYSYQTSTTDPEGDDVYYQFDWGDGSTSGWLGPYTSGQTISADNSWNNDGSYEIKVAAKDSHGKISEWSDTLSISMPRDRNINSLFLNFLENHPNMFPVLRYFLGL